MKHIHINLEFKPSDMIPMALATMIFAASWFFFSPFEDTQWPKWMVFYWLAGLHIGICIYRGTKRIELLLLMLSVMASGAMAFIDRRTFDHMHIVSQIDLMGHGARATLAFMTCVMLWLCTSPRYFNFLIDGLVGAAAINQVVSLFQYWILGNENWQSSGFLPNYSMASCMVAMILPLALSRRANPIAWTCALTAIPTVWMSQSSIGFVALFVGIGAFIVSIGFTFFRQVAMKILGFTAVLVPATVIALGFTVDPQWSRFMEISRFKMWIPSLQYWLDHGSIWFGVGLGSYRHFGSVIQTQQNVEVGHWWLWMHNDWFQVLFETGIFGFTSALLVLLAALWSAFRAGSAGLFGSICALSVVAFGNYPLRLAEFALAATVIMGAALNLPRARRFKWKKWSFNF